MYGGRGERMLYLHWQTDGLAGPPPTVRLNADRRAKLLIYLAVEGSLLDAYSHKAKADLLHKLADENDRGLLCTAEWLSVQPSLKNEQPPKAGDAKVQPERDDPYRYRR